MFTMPLRRMKLRTKELESSYGASYGTVRKSKDAVHQYDTFHQGWDLESRLARRVLPSPVASLPMSATTRSSDGM